MSALKHLKGLFPILSLLMLVACSSLFSEENQLKSLTKDTILYLNNQDIQGLLNLTPKTEDLKAVDPGLTTSQIEALQQKGLFSYSRCIQAVEKLQKETGASLKVVGHQLDESTRAHPYPTLNIQALSGTQTVQLQAKIVLQKYRSGLVELQMIDEK